MANANKAKGDRWERAVVAYTKKAGFPDAERTEAGYHKDRGDIGRITGVVLQAKDSNAKPWTEWLDDLRTQVENADAQVGALVVKRRGTSDVGRALFVMEYKDGLALLRESGRGLPLYGEEEENNE